MQVAKTKQPLKNKGEEQKEYHNNGGNQDKGLKVQKKEKKTLPCFLVVRPLGFFMFPSFSLPLIHTAQTKSHPTPQSIQPDKKGEDKKHLFLMAASKTITGAFEKLPEGGSSLEC